MCSLDILILALQAGILFIESSLKGAVSGDNSLDVKPIKIVFFGEVEADLFFL